MGITTIGCLIHVDGIGKKKAPASKPEPKVMEEETPSGPPIGEPFGS
jgi:hypothetical protein